MRFLIVLAASAVLAGCSSSGDLKPEKLLDIDNKVKFDQVWSKDAGSIDNKRYNLIQPAYSRGRVVLMDARGYVSAYDSETGDRLWRVRLKEPVTYDIERRWYRPGTWMRKDDKPVPTSGGVGIFDDAVAVGSYEGQVFLLDAETGEERWRQQVSSEVLSAPQPNDDVVVVHTVDGKIHGLDLATGEKRWQYDNPQAVLSLRGSASPLVTPSMVVAGFDNGKIAAINPDNGVAMWDQRVAIPKGRTEFERVVDVDGTPLMVGDLIFAASYQGRIVALSRAAGRGIWAQDVSTHSNLASNGSAVFVTTDDDSLVAFNIANGEEVWTNDQMLHRSLTGPAYLSGFVVVADADGHLHVLDASTGEYLARKKIDGSGVNSPLSVMGDKLLVLDNDGRLHVLTLSEITEQDD
ncbi:outer membrane protein assembly factor BamB [Halioxenophilus aromaticivorans]|uniref:Outer membrane protein assembly factor BamB n=1 Tax=Halioxenophilus aromaticivorans TaxID=1306992 RepID=A0AAV3TZV6_9ALTE